MDSLALLTEARGAGLEIRVDGGRLVIRGPKSAAPLAAQLLGRKDEVITLLTHEDDDVAWRAAIMREQARGRTSLPFLVVRRNFRDVPGVCMSCDGPLDNGRPIRCTFCARAAKLVADKFLEGIRPVSVPRQVLGG